MIVLLFEPNIKTMKRLIVALTLLSLQAFAQKPEKIYPINVQERDQDFYKTQSKLWGEEVKKHPKNADAWKNYYNASRYIDGVFRRDKGADKEKMIYQIVAEMEKNVPTSVEFYDCKAGLMGNSNTDTTSYLKIVRKGLAIDPNDVGLLECYINYCEINGKPEKLKDLYTRLYNSNRYTEGIMETAYNILMSLDKNAIVFVDADDDTYPMRMLQELKGIRSDVTIMNTSFTTYLPEYSSRMLKKLNISISDKILNRRYYATEPMDFLKDLVVAIHQSNPDIPIFFDIFCRAEKTFPDSLYCTGLAWKYSPVKINNIARLKNNIENHFHLNYLDSYYNNDGVSAGVVEDMKTSYVTPFAILYKYYLEMGESNDRTEFYKNFIMKYAAKLGKDKEMEEFLQGKKSNI